MQNATKRGKFILIVSVICITILSILFSKNLNVNEIDTGYLQIKSYDRNIFQESNLHKALNKSFMTNQYQDHFSSAGLTMPLPNLYNAYWVNKLINKSSLEIKNGLVNSDLMQKSFEAETLPPLLKYQYVTGIYHMSGNNDYDKKSIVNSISKNFDKSTRLFFLKNKTDDIYQKLSTTLTVTKIYNYMKIPFPEREEVVKGIKMILNDEKYKQNGERSNVFNFYTTIVSILNELGYKDYSQLNLNSISGSLLSTVNNDINKLINSDNPYSFIYLKKMCDLNLFYKKKVKYTKNQLDEISKSTFFNNNQKFIVDPIVMNTALDLYNSIDTEFPYKKELMNYIQDQIKSDFSKASTISVNLEENYYGLAVSSVSNFDFNKESQKKFIKESFTRIFTDDTTISSYEKLKDIYFLILSHFVLDLEIVNKDELAQSVEVFLNEFDFTSDKEIMKKLNSLDLGIQLMLFLKKDISSKLQEKIKEFTIVVNRYPEALENIDVSYKIFNILNGANIDDNQLINQLLSKIETLRAEKGYKSTINSSAADVFSTYKALSIKKKMGTLDQVTKSIAKSYILSDIRNDTLTGFQTEFVQFNLKSLYFSMLLSNYYQSS